MLNFTSLYSGSSGNCLFVETQNTKILIDAGVSLRKIEKGLESINVEPSDLNAVIITHEHTDHIQSLGNLSKKFDLPVFATSSTFDAMPKQTEKISDTNKKSININEKFSIGDIEILPFQIPHDAVDPCGFTFFSNNTKISIATDIGHMTNNIIKKIDGSEFILLESNYDCDVLKYTKYPFKLKERIAGPTGHLSNKIAGQTINYLINSGLKKAVLGHLSKESNFPELAYQTVMDEIISSGTNIDGFNLSVAQRDCPGEIIKIS